MTDLFPTARSLSPRLAWLEKHGLTLFRGPTKRWWVYLDDENRADGRTRDDACWRFSRKFKIMHWLEEDLTNARNRKTD